MNYDYCGAGVNGQCYCDVVVQSSYTKYGNEDDTQYCTNKVVGSNDYSRIVRAVYGVQQCCLYTEQQCCNYGGKTVMSTGYVSG